MHCTSTIPTDHFITLCAPSEPVCFTSCDGPHSGTSDDQRPPHWLDVQDLSWTWNRRPIETDRRWLAEVWAREGFTAADCHAWSAVGITSPWRAADCARAGFRPNEPADRAFFESARGRHTWARLIDTSKVTAVEAMDAYKGAP